AGAGQADAFARAREQRLLERAAEEAAALVVERHAPELAARVVFAVFHLLAAGRAADRDRQKEPGLSSHDDLRWTRPHRPLPLAHDNSTGHATRTPARFYAAFQPRGPWLSSGGHAARGATDTARSEPGRAAENSARNRSRWPSSAPPTQIGTIE